MAERRKRLFRVSVKRDATTAWIHHCIGWAFDPFAEEDDATTLGERQLFCAMDVPENKIVDLMTRGQVAKGIIYLHLIHPPEGMGYILVFAALA